jgi:hypothetical protein
MTSFCARDDHGHTRRPLANKWVGRFDRRRRRLVGIVQKARDVSVAQRLNLFDSHLFPSGMLDR